MQASLDVLNTAHPGRQTLIDDLFSLLSVHSQSFLYIYDPFTPHRTANLLSQVASVVQASPGLIPLAFADIDAVESFNPRLIYDKILDSLACWDTTWDQGAEIWTGGVNEISRYNQSFDAFTHGLCAVRKHLDGDPNLVIMIQRPERLPLNLVVPIARLADLTGIPVTTIMLSEVRWEDVRPTVGSCHAPYHILIPPLQKQEITQSIATSFPVIDVDTISPYNPVLKPLFIHFLDILQSACAPYTQNPIELEYLAAARWPEFVSQILQDWRDRPLPYPPPSEDTRMKLLTQFKHTFTSSLESLYPRKISASQWIEQSSIREELPSKIYVSRMGKFISVAAFLASYNPAKSDVRMFCRTIDERGRRRRIRSSRRQVKSGVAKISQHLLGPNTFPLDRLIAILGSLLEEYDSDTARAPSEHPLTSTIYTEMQVSRIEFLSVIPELISMKYLYRASASDRLDTPTYKCNLSLEQVSKFAQDLGIPIRDLMWDPVSL